MFTLTLKSKKRAIYYGFLKVERSQKIVFKLNFFSTPYLHRFTLSNVSLIWQKKLWVMVEAMVIIVNCTFHAHKSSYASLGLLSSVFIQRLIYSTYISDCILSQALSFLITSLLLKLVSMSSQSNQSSGRQTYTP